MILYAIVGSGGFAREIMPLALDKIIDNKLKNIKVYFVEKEQVDSRLVNGIDCISEDQFFKMEAKEKYFNVAISDSKIRERVVTSFLLNGCKPFAITSDKTIVLSNNSIGSGSVICPFSTITSNTMIGNYFHLNIYSYVAHDCVIGDYVTFAPKVCCNGNVIIEDHAYIGAGAIIRNGTPENPLVIGYGAVIGMGSVVTKSVPPKTVVVGSPARQIKK